MCAVFPFLHMVDRVLDNFCKFLFYFIFSNQYLCLELQIGWIYGSVTEDILTGFKMHARGWRSIYCMPKRPAFKGSAPINLSDRLNQVLRWALGSVEILLSRHCPIWYGYNGRLKWLERFAYINTTIYPITALPLLMYCTLPAVCLLTNKFIIPQVCYITKLIFCTIMVSLSLLSQQGSFFFNNLFPSITLCNPCVLQELTVWIASYKSLQCLLSGELFVILLQNMKW